MPQTAKNKQRTSKRDIALANLPEHRFPKGSSGNPAGRVAGTKNVSTVLKELLAEVAPDVVVDQQFIQNFCRGKKNITIADAVAVRMVHEAVNNGESWAVKEVLDRTEGKPQQTVEIETKTNYTGILAQFRVMISAYAFENKMTLEAAVIKYLNECSKDLKADQVEAIRGEFGV